MRARATRARARGERRSPSEEKPFFLSRPNLSSSFAINLDKFTFSLAARGSEERRTTARGLSLTVNCFYF